MKHFWEATYTPGEGDERHLARMVIYNGSALFGRPIPGTRFRTDVLQNGAGVVAIRIRVPLLGEVIVWEFTTPCQPMVTEVQHNVWASRFVPRWIAKIVVHHLVLQFERDIMVWHHKTFVRSPLVAKEEPSIPKFRRWYQQFYSAASKTMDQISMDW
eukprot:TRINITY_DN4696_c0_g1_i2.p1 TRINITY_DN4696_c0_g1~~TRINITY_DN4696_c0_g1_i2.p1  ORF type:complete len:157 (+),score=20.42 TRINITY_DN4696_c0_g1_i2:98-568(+)